MPAAHAPSAHGPAAHYGAAAALLHWLTALLIIATVPLGAVLHDLPRVPASFVYYDIHKSIGGVVFFLVCARLLWRLTHPAPPLPASQPAWQRHAAHTVHALLYLLMLAVPLVGWAASQAGGHPLVLFRLLPLPAPVPVDPALNEALHQVHAALAWTLTALVALHVLAVAKHHLMDRDTTLWRMTAALRRTRRG